MTKLLHIQNKNIPTLTQHMLHAFIKYFNVTKTQIYGLQHVNFIFTKFLLYAHTRTHVRALQTVDRYACHYTLPGVIKFSPFLS